MIPTKVKPQRPCENISQLVRLNLTEEAHSSVKRLFTTTLGLDPIVGIGAQEGCLFYEHTEKNGRPTGFRVVEIPRGYKGVEYLLQFNPEDSGHHILAGTITSSLKREYGFKDARAYPFLDLLEQRETLY